MLDSSRESSILLAPDGRVLAINQIGASRLKSTPDALVAGMPMICSLRGCREAQEGHRAGHCRTTSDGLPGSAAGFFFDQSVYPILMAGPG